MRYIADTLPMVIVAARPSKAHDITAADFPSVRQVLLVGQMLSCCVLSCA